jgi:hypothetical protein
MRICVLGIVEEVTFLHELIFLLIANVKLPVEEFLTLYGA